jgi:transcriptional regulator with XRE-family HTH domain
MKRHKFAELRATMSPRRRARNEAAARSMMAEMLLSELREESGMTQRDLAAALGIKQPTLAQMEKQDDMQVSTLRRIVEALGGELDLIVRLPHGEFRVPQFQRKRPA